jgi:hypothetical protein
LAFEGQLDAATAEEIVGGLDEVEDLAHAHVGDGLVRDLLHLDRRDTHRQSSAQHDPVFTEGLACDQRGELHHEPRPSVEAAVSEHLVEGEVVEVGDEFRVSLLEGRYMYRVLPITG